MYVIFMFIYLFTMLFWTAYLVDMSWASLPLVTAMYKEKQNTALFVKHAGIYILISSLHKYRCHML